MRRIVARGLGEDQRELVAAVAGRDVGGAQRRPHQLGHVDQDAVAVEVAEAVVDELEVVQVEHHDAQRPVGPHGAHDLLGQPLVQVAVVEEAGQRVAVGEVARGLVQARVLERHRGLVGHRRRQRDPAGLGRGRPDRHELDQPDRLALRDQRQHDQAAHAVAPQQARSRRGRRRGRRRRPSRSRRPRAPGSSAGYPRAGSSRPCPPRAEVGKQPSVRSRPLGRSQSLIWARSAPTARATCSAIRSATARGSSERDRALFMSRSCRSSDARRRVSARLAVPLNEVPAWSARIVSRRRSSSSNWRSPSFERVITPISFPSCCIGTIEHRFVDVVGARDRLAARVRGRVVDPQRLPVHRDPPGEALAELRLQDREVDVLVGPDAALERDRHEVVRRLEEVDAGVVVVDDPARLLDHGAAHLLAGQAGAHPSRRVLERAQLRLAAHLGGARPSDQGAGGEDRAADREIEDDRELLERRRAALQRPAGDARGQDAEPGDEREPMKSRRPLATALAAARPPQGLKTGVHERDADSATGRRGTSRKYLFARPCPGQPVPG